MALVDMWGEPLGERVRAEHAIVTTLDALQATRQTGALPRQTAVQVPPDTAPEALVPWLCDLDLVCIEFPKFRDGRGFTLAHVLRTRHRFEHELRAVGHLLPDQLEALRYCGFSSVLTTDEHPPEQWASGEQASVLREGQSASRTALPLLNRLISRRVS